VWNDTVQSGANVRKIGFEMVVQRGGNTENQGIDLIDLSKVRGSLKTTSLGGFRQRFGRNVLDVTFPGKELLGFLAVDIKADGLETFVNVSKKEREPDIAETDDSYFMGFRLDIGKVRGHRVITSRVDFETENFRYAFEEKFVSHFRA
jgi:hypothetical protein